MVAAISIAKTTTMGYIGGSEVFSFAASGWLLSVSSGKGEGVEEVSGRSDIEGVGDGDDDGSGVVSELGFGCGEGDGVIVGDACGVEKLNGGDIFGGYPVPEAM